MDVQAAEIRAFLNDDKDADSRVDKAYADGQAEILRTAPDRTRKGTADHAIYEVAENKIVLFGGHPLFVDSLRGSTQGRQLTYFSDSDRLLVDGQPSEPAKHRIVRPPKDENQQSRRSAITRLHRLDDEMLQTQISKSYRGRKVVDNVSV